MLNLLLDIIREHFVLTVFYINFQKIVCISRFWSFVRNKKLNEKFGHRFAQTKIKHVLVLISYPENEDS